MILSLCATHKKASVPILESFTFEDEGETMKELYRLPFVEECILIQTCNRVEIHVVVSNVSSKEAVDQLVGFWSQNVGVSRDVILQVIEVFEGRETLQHLLFLAAGLDSMVTGEDQILGQIRKAYVQAKKIGVAKSSFETIFMKAVNVGRKVRTETAINQGSVSISSVAVDLAEKFFGHLKSIRVLLIGAGEAGTLAGKELASRGVENVLVANRTYERGVQLAKTIGGEAVRLEDVNNYTPRVNLVILAASADTPLLTFEGVKGALTGVDKTSELLVIDISQPRCVEEAVGDLVGVNLKTIDDLRCVVEENLKKRSSEAERARKIVLREMDHLEVLLKKMVVEPTISGLCGKVEKIRLGELSKALHILRGVDDHQRMVIEDLTRVLTERILQLPIKNLRDAALNGDNSLLSAARKLFNLVNEHRRNE